MELKQKEADFENQNFEDLDINPYELVIAVSKKAREINSKALKYLGPETEIKPISIVLNKLKDGDVSFKYDEGEKSGELTESDTVASDLTATPAGSEDGSK